MGELFRKSRECVFGSPSFSEILINSLDSSTD